jgi:hypothetical protein
MCRSVGSRGCELLFDAVLDTPGDTLAVQTISWHALLHLWAERVSWLYCVGSASCKHGDLAKQLACKVLKLFNLVFGLHQVLQLFPYRQVFISECCRLFFLITTFVPPHYEQKASKGKDNNKNKKHGSSTITPKRSPSI